MTDEIDALECGRIEPKGQASLPALWREAAVRAVKVEQVNAATLRHRFEDRTPPAPRAGQPVYKDDRFALACDPIRGRRPVDHELPNLHDHRFRSTFATSTHTLRNQRFRTDDPQPAGGFRRTGAGRLAASEVARMTSVSPLPTDDLDEPASVALAVEFEKEHALPSAEAELAAPDGDCLARRPEQHGHAMGVHVRDPHTLVLAGGDLGATVPVVMRVVVVVRDQPAQHHREVLEEAALPLVHPHRAGRVRGVDVTDAVAHAARTYRIRDLFGDVR